MELISITRAPRLMAFIAPLATITCSTTSLFSSMVIMTSAVRTASAGVAATVASAANGSHLLAVRFHKFMEKPASSRLRVMGAPMRPMPRNAIRGSFSIIGVGLYPASVEEAIGQAFPKHAVNTSMYARLRHPWLRTVLETPAQSPLILECITHHTNKNATNRWPVVAFSGHLQMLYLNQAASVICVRIFFMAFFSNWRMRSAEIPYLSAN